MIHLTYKITVYNFVDITNLIKAEVPVEKLRSLGKNKSLHRYFFNYIFN